MVDTRVATMANSGKVIKIY